MYHRGDIDHWTDEELIELWRERSAMRESESVVQADYSAGQEIRRWVTRPLPEVIRRSLLANLGTKK